MAYIAVKQKVENFDSWHKVLKSHEKTLEEAGLKNLQLLRDFSDSNIVVCIFRADNIEQAKAFTQTPQANEDKQELGIIGEPEVLLLREI